MKSIAYVLPYFGKFPKGFQFWLMSCKANSSVDFFVFTDDYTKYDYPENVHVTYCTLQEVKKRAQKLFDFKISLERPYKLCDYKPAYGEIFEEELKGYDYWGHCDLDMVWGDIRKFITDDILEQYEKIGNQGHSTLYKNTPEVNARYRTCIPGIVNYKIAYSTDQGFAFDEPPMEEIYKSLGIPYYQEVNFVHLKKYDYGFFMDLLSADVDYKNEYQVFTWKNGIINRFYVDKEQIQIEEYMYLHYWCRPTTFKIKEYKEDKQYLIYPDVTTDKEYEISCDLIKKKSRRSKVKYYAKSIWFNRKKLTFKRILFNIRGMMSYRK